MKEGSLRRRSHMTNTKAAANPIKADKTVEAIIITTLTALILIVAAIIDDATILFTAHVNPIYFLLTFWMEHISLYFMLGLSGLFLVIIHVLLWPRMKGFFWKGVITGHTYAMFILLLFGILGNLRVF
jgi:hypothetical protein